MASEEMCGARFIEQINLPDGDGPREPMFCRTESTALEGRPAAVGVLRRRTRRMSHARRLKPGNHPDFYRRPDRPSLHSPITRLLRPLTIFPRKAPAPDSK